jgi:hypothetical protein
LSNLKETLDHKFDVLHSESVRPSEIKIINNDVQETTILEFLKQTISSKIEPGDFFVEDRIDDVVP